MTSPDLATLPHGQPTWLNSAAHRYWLENEGQRLLAFYRASRIETGGFGPLDDHGRLPNNARADTMITARMTHCFALACQRGEPGAAPLAEHGLACLQGDLRDSRFGGWYAQVPHEGFDDAKQCYILVFVALAACTAFQAGLTGAQALLNEALATIEDHFWDEAAGRVREAFSRDWREQEAYRGGNSNMHAIELFVQLADVLSEPEWRRRALSIATHLIHNQAAANDYLVIEHFDAAWQPWWDYNANQPAHGFRPYGLTPGHACEWSRLLLHLEAGLVREGKHPPDWLRRAAEWLFTAAMTYGWQVDGAPGMVYTVDWEKRPHVHQRVHWAVAEAAAAAAALLRRTGDFAYERWYRIMWDYIDRYLIDRANGSWHQELDRHNRPASRIWSGKPDLYHAYQATLLPRLPLAPAIAVSVVDSNR